MTDPSTEAEPSRPREATACRGFRLGGIRCGIKEGDELDLGLLAAEEPVSTAAVFTRNRVRAAPVELAEARLERGRAQAVLVNSGCANACTGEEGARAARGTTAAVAEAMGIEPALVLPASTGVIGTQLPGDTIESAAPQLVEALSTGPEGVDAFSRAILTTDNGPKVASRTIALDDGTEIAVLGIAKGAGMIHPRMATTLAFILTDAPMHSSFLRSALRAATDRTFNCISVDGDTSTNDTIVAMSSSAVQVEPLRNGTREGKLFQDGVTAVLEELGKMIVADGEGAQRVVRVEVTGAPSEDAAHMVAERIGSSMLVKTAIHGHDANWGRIVAAAGMAGVAFDPSKLQIRFGDELVVKSGMGLGEIAEAKAREVMRQAEYTITLDLGAGDAKGHYLTCDLGHAYVDVNAAYRT